MNLNYNEIYKFKFILNGTVKAVKILESGIFDWANSNEKQENNRKILKYIEKWLMQNASACNFPTLSLTGEYDNANNLQRVLFYDQAGIIGSCQIIKLATGRVGNELESLGLSLEDRKLLNQHIENKSTSGKACDIAEKPKQTEFEIFKEKFLFWKEKLGLKNWEILYFVEKSSKEKDTPYATINYIVEQRQAWVYFYGSGNNTDINVNTQALHEALHLLVADCKTEPFVEHSIINTIIACFKDKEIFEELKG